MRSAGGASKGSRSQGTPEIKTVTSPDMPCTPAAWRPEHLDQVYALLEFTIGRSGDDAADLVSVLIATPEALRRRAEDTLVLADRGVLMVGHYDWPALRAHLDEIVRTCGAGRTWVETTSALQRYFHWEYQDMR